MEKEKRYPRGWDSSENGSFRMHPRESLCSSTVAHQSHHESHTRGGEAQKEKEMLLFHFVFESLIDSINLNFVLSKHTSVKNQTDSIILIFKKIFDHLSKDCDRLFEKSSSSMVKRNRFQSISRDFAWDGGEGLCIARRGTRRNRK